MLKPPVSVSMAFVRGMVAGMQARGLDPDPMLCGAGIDPALLHETGARVTGEQYVALFGRIVEGMDDDGLGFYSRRLKVGCFALLVRAALGAPRLEVGMRRFAHSFGLLQDDVQIVIEPVTADGGLLSRSSLVFADDRVRPNFMHEMLLRIYWRVLAWLVGGRLAPVRFDLAFPAPAYAGSYRFVLPGELRFDQPHSALWIDAQALAEPIRRDEAALRSFLSDVPRNIVLPHRRDDAFASRVRVHLHQVAPAWPDLATTAAALHMSSSTLQRNLAAEGCTYQALKDELRRDLAISRLNTSTVPLAALAGELGFSDSAAFQRAFKAWTGSPPGAYRRRGG